MKLIRPNYYTSCSDYGREILDRSKFPNKELYEKECIEVINQLDLNFYSGNALKYVWRLNNKGLFVVRRMLVKKDLKKALFYITECIRLDKPALPDWINGLKTVLNQEIYD